MDNFYEQLLTTSKTTTYKLVSKATYVLGLIGLFFTSVNMIFAILLIALAVACYFYKSKLYVEYEYQFTNGEIDIEKILEMKKRKKVTTFNIKEVDLLALSDSDFVKDYSNKPTSIVKCYPTTAKGRIYVAMITEGNDKMQLMFMPDEKFINHCFKYNPRAVKK
ncbi:DUF6106 family protein [Clostridium estertheticum]|uniref:DUF6106 family protein n=1 Tax=Clostridium estertheticum TaxID=238834 RepID=A0AA47I5C5_9CLOT|nr:DUF6106 family protein [Clostridium estertheticum]MBU3156110.1 hypothetical protein [Clostridium estertheticum]MBU3199341.1 hypothetical protein [Clostridium estertheticum]WAG58550.1 DUF6106 family protein [Clostridium estertheticum]WAG67414.1 DUF6106 family protein [Clostridium estertheticum]